MSGIGAVLVVGPESSGTRYLRRLLCLGGCAGEASDGPDQPFLDPETLAVRVPAGTPGPIVISRSYPHGPIWPDVVADTAALFASGRRTAVVVLVRDARCCELSQVRNGHAADLGEARARIAEAYRRIFRGLDAARAEFVVAPYRSLGSDSFRRWLLVERLGLTQPAEVDWRDGDAPYE